MEDAAGIHGKHGVSMEMRQATAYSPHLELMVTIRSTWKHCRRCNYKDMIVLIGIRIAKRFRFKWQMMKRAIVPGVSASARATLRSHAEARYARWVWGGVRQSRLPPTQGERREGHDLGFQRLLEPLVPLAAPFPPARRCIRKTN